MRHAPFQPVGAGWTFQMVTTVGLLMLLWASMSPNTAAIALSRCESDIESCLRFPVPTFPFLGPDIHKSTSPLKTEERMLPSTEDSQRLQQFLADSIANIVQNGPPLQATHLSKQEG